MWVWSASRSWIALQNDWQSLIGFNGPVSLIWLGNWTDSVAEYVEETVWIKPFNRKYILMTTNELYWKEEHYKMVNSENSPMQML